MTPTLPSTLPDDVELLETLGAGAFGTVYVARLLDGALSRTVVLKVLKQDWSKEPEALRRARDEAAMLSRLNHDNIVRVERLTTWRGHVTVVMEHLVGLSLDHVLRHHGPLPVWSALEITSRVCSALDAAYAGVPPGETKALRIVHRDIKPSNILLTVSGAVKVLDFGAARAEFDAREAATRSMAFGTPLYMAPECFDAGPPGPAVDIYALGATLFELLHGEPLGKLSVSPQRFWPALQARLNQVQHTDLPDGPARDATLELLSRTLRYDPDRRPDAQTLRAALRELMNKQPIPRYGLDQLGETVVDPLYRRRTVLPATPPEGTLAVHGAVSTPPPIPQPTPQPSPERAPTLFARPNGKKIVSKRASAPIPPSALGEWPPPAAAPPAREETPLTVPTPPPRVKPRAAATPAPETPRRGWWAPLLVMAAGLGVGGVIAVALTVGGEEPTPPVETPITVSPPKDDVTEVAPKKLEPDTVAPAPPQKPESKEDEPVPTPVKPPEPKEPKPPPPPKAPAQTGALSLKSIPAGATVSVKGQTPCETPCALTLPQGAHTVSVSFPVSAAGPEVSGRCSVQLGETATLKMRRTEDAVLCE